MSYFAHYFKNKPVFPFSENVQCNIQLFEPCLVFHVSCKWKSSLIRNACSTIRAPTLLLFLFSQKQNNLSRLPRLTDMCISSCIPTWILVQRCITPFCKLFFFKKVSINVEWLHLRGCSKTTLIRFWLFLTTYPPNGMNVDKFLDHLPNLSCKHSL